MDVFVGAYTVIGKANGISVFQMDPQTGTLAVRETLVGKEGVAIQDVSHVSDSRPPWALK